MDDIKFYSVDELKNEIRYGLFDFGDASEMAVTSYGYIKRDIFDIKNNYISLGFHLNEMRVSAYYQELGYDDFYECIEKNFGLDKSAVSRCISVWVEFCARDDTNHAKMWIDKKYENYSYSQLCEMLPLDKEERKKILPDMTIKQIREKKKELKENKVVATSQLQDDKVLLTKDDLINLRGAALQSKIKSVDYEDLISIAIYDADTGKRVVHTWSELLFKDKETGCLYVRAHISK